MNKPITPPKPSLLERAGHIYDLNDALKGRSLPPVSVPESAMRPAVRPFVDVDAQAAAAARAAQAPQPVQAPHSAPAAPQTDAAIPVAPAAAPTRPAPPPAPLWTGAPQAINVARMSEAGYLVPNAPVSGLGEEFRILKRDLREWVQATALTGNGSMMLVTSAHSGDGKTFCTINLAVSMAAESDLEVLLVDADFAKPSVVSALGLHDGPGLMDVLADPSLRVQDCVITTTTPSLFVLPAGKSTNRDAENLASARMDMIASELVRGRPNRLVIFDSPPLLAASPAAVLATKVDGTILVVRADRTSEAALRDAAHLLGNGADKVRLLLNGVRFCSSGRRFGHYYGKGS